MTTPERLKRRQMIEAAALIVIGVLMIIQSLYFEVQREKQNECFAKQFALNAQVLTARSRYSDQDSKSTSTFLLGVNAVNNAPVSKYSQAERQKRINELLTAYANAQKEISENRQKHPVPPFPEGKCD